MQPIAAGAASTVDLPSIADMRFTRALRRHRA
jgi:hypothetical protein